MGTPFFASFLLNITFRPSFCNSLVYRKFVLKKVKSLLNIPLILILFRIFALSKEMET